MARIQFRSRHDGGVWGSGGRVVLAGNDSAFAEEKSPRAGEGSECVDDYECTVKKDRLTVIVIIGRGGTGINGAGHSGTTYALEREIQYSQCLSESRR